MATQVAELVAKLSMDTKDFDRGVRDADKSLDKLEDSSKSTGTAAASMGSSFRGAGLAMKAMAGGYAATQVLGFAKSAITSFSNLEESTNAVGVVFEDAAGTITDFGSTSADAVGLAQSEFQQLATTTGALLTNFGYNTQEAADETLNLTKRAADLASVFNTDVSDAMGAISAAIRGETEPIRRYAVDVSDASLAQYALAQGIEKSVSAMTAQEKGALRVQVLMAQSAKVQGDFANTSDSLANSQKRLNARMEDAKATIGKELAPAMTELLEVGVELVPTFVAVASAVASATGALASLSNGASDSMAKGNELQAVWQGFTGAAKYLASPLWALTAGLRDSDEAAKMSSKTASEATETYYVQSAVVASLAELHDKQARGIRDAGDAASDYAGDQQKMTDALLAADSAARSLIQTLDSGSWVRRASERIRATRFFGPGGAARDEGRVDGFQSGGIVPGPMGAPRMAIVHGGEEVLTASQRAQRNVTVNMNGNVTSGGRLGDELTMALLMAGVNEQAEFHGLADIRG